MAEATKRPHEIAGKAPASSSSSPEQVLEAALGASIRLRTLNPHLSALEGKIYAACPYTNLLVLAVGSDQDTTYHLVPIASLISFEILPLPIDPTLVPGPSLANSQTQLSRANAAVTKAKVKAAKVNKAVDKQVQDLFDALDKQFTARWNGRDIIVMERVVVKCPGYRSEDCKVITQDGEGLLGRVRKVLENEKRRAAQRDGWKSVKPAVPNIVPAIPVVQGQRKGG